MKKIDYAIDYVIDLFPELHLDEWKNQELLKKKVRWCMRSFHKETLKHHFEEKVKRLALEKTFRFY